MSTSLAEQLKRLAIPQTKVLTDSKKRASLLFDPLEAAKISKESVFEIGREGIKELIGIDSNFADFEDTLFNHETKYVQRAVESKDVNKKLDKIISKFLIRLSPYLLLKATHKALEWLIYRYQIHELNVSQLFALTLPYHEANIFVKVLQLIDLKSAVFKSWSWLQPLQKQGLHLPKQVLVTHAISDSSFLRFICDSTEKALKEHGKTGTESKLRTLLAFYASALMGVLGRGPTNDHLLTVLLPSLLAGLKSQVPDFKAGAYMALGQLIANNQLETGLSSKLLQIIMQDDSDILRTQRVYLVLMLFQRQQPPPSLPFELIKDWDWAVPVLAELGQRSVLAGPLALAIVEACLDRVVGANEEGHDAQILCWSLAEQVQCDDDSAASILRLMLSYYERIKGPAKGKKQKKANEAVNSSAADWLRVLLETFCAKYADSFDKIQDPELQNLRRQCAGEEADDVLDSQIASLVRKCMAGHRAAWTHLKPILLKQIHDSDRMFKVWCKAAPASEPMTLLLILERVLRPGNDQLARRLTAKVAESTYGSSSQFITHLKNTLEENNDTTAQEAVEKTIRSVWCSEFEGRWNLKQWIAAINEMRASGQFAAVNNVWACAMKMLIPFLKPETPNEETLEITSALDYITTIKIKQRVDVLSSLLTHTELWDRLSDGWFDLSKLNFLIFLRVKILEVILRSLHDSKTVSLKKKFAFILSLFTKNCFSDSAHCLGFTMAVAAGLPFPSRTDILLSPLFQVHALHHVWSVIHLGKSQLRFDVERPQLLCHLLMALSSSSMAVRRAAIKAAEVLKAELKNKSFSYLLRELSNRFSEITADPEQLSVGLYCILSTGDAKGARDGLIKILNSPDIPLYVAARVTVVLELITSDKILKDLVPLTRRALDCRCPEDAWAANTLVGSYWKRLTSSTCSTLKDSQVWGLVKLSLAHKKCDTLCPAVTFLKAVDKDLFAAISSKQQEALLELMVATRAETDSANVSSAVAAVCRKISMDATVMLHLLEKMVAALPKELNTPPSSILESRPWRHGITLLELIQNKKKLRNSCVLIRSLYAVLKFCLDQEEQTTFEYGKQLVLGCMLEICERHVAGTEHVEVAILDVELIVQCLRASANPQTHHHALLLLSCLGSIIPVQVMHNMMAIFTFMGSSVARLDDEHSVQVVAKVVDTVVPVLVESLKAKTSSEAVVAEVLRIFVWTLRDVPQHRRIPLFERLLTTLGPDRALWIFLLLLCENYVVSAHRVDKKTEGSMPPSLQLGLELSLSFGPEVVLNTTLKLINYLTQIPMDKMNPVQNLEKMDEDDNESDGLFDIRKHTPKQLRHYTYTLFTFLNTMLADQNLILQVRELDASGAEKLELVFKDSMAALLLYTPQCATQQQTQLAKFWKTMASLGYDVLDRLVALVSSDTLVGVITKLLKHSADALRRKAVDLLNVHIQTHRGGFSAEEKVSLAKLVTPLLAVAIAPPAHTASGEGELIQQTALLSLRLLAKVLAADDPQSFKHVLVEVTKLCKSNGHVLASAALTVADLVAHLKVRAVSELPNFLPALLKKLSQYVPAESTDLVLMSLSAALYRVVEALAPFLSPYMDKMLHSVCCIAIRWPEAADLNRKLLQIRQKIATNVPHRVLVPSLGRCYKQLIAEKRFEAIGPLLTVLAESLTSVPEVSRLLPELTPFFIQVLQIRSDAADGTVPVNDEEVLLVEGYGIDALLPLVLKLSELSFKPLYYQIFHWASEHPHRAITFYRLSSRLAEGLKGLFVLFAGHFLQNAATLLDATNATKAEKPYFGPGEANETKAILLLENIIQTLHTVFLFDSTTFLTKDKFQALLHPLVDQLDNTLGGTEKLDERSKRLLTPCLAQMTLATDDTQWKALNYQLLTKTRSSSPLVRIAALNTVVEVAAKLGEDYLPLLPETIGSLAELLEDEDERVEEAMKEALRRMEDDLGQPIREYFQ